MRGGSFFRCLRSLACVDLHARLCLESVGRASFSFLMDMDIGGGVRLIKDLGFGGRHKYLYLYLEVNGRPTEEWLKAQVKCKSKMGPPGPCP